MKKNITWNLIRISNQLKGINKAGEKHEKYH